jgi:hypothetical protein
MASESKPTNRIFLLSPAHCGGKRAQFLLREDAQSAVAERLRRAGVPIGEVFSFVSGLYFRGKLAYANAYAKPPIGAAGVLVITPTRGLMQADDHIELDTLRDFARMDIDVSEPRYRDPLERDATRLAHMAGDDCEVVLLGSLATTKYLSILHPIFSERLRYPREFVGRGDMSRGSLMLKCVEAGLQLEYVCVSGDASSKGEKRSTAQGPNPRID